MSQHDATAKDALKTESVAKNDNGARAQPLPQDEPGDNTELNLEGEAENVADAGDTGEGGKLKMIMSLLKRCLGVKDLAAMCVLPPHLI